MSKSQQKALTSAIGALSLTQSPIEKTTAETIEALHDIDVNDSFATSDGDSDRTARMLPDSKIVC